MLIAICRLLVIHLSIIVFAFRLDVPKMARRIIRKNLLASKIKLQLTRFSYFFAPTIEKRIECMVLRSSIKECGKLLSAL